MQKNNWKKCKLGDVCNLLIDHRGKTPKKLGGNWESFPVGYRALSAKNIKMGQIVQEDSIKYVNESLYKKWMKDEIQYGDILITSEAPFGQVYLWNSYEKIVLSQRLFGLRIKKSFYPRFIYYYMTTQAFQEELKARSTGTTVIGLRQPELLKCAISYPIDFDEQKRIAEVLGAFDDKIELLQKQNKTLEDMAKAIFKSWFVDFDVVKAKQRGDSKANIMREYHLSEELYDLFPSSFEDSSLDPIPTGWKVKNLSDIATLTMGQSPVGTTYNETGKGVPFYQGCTDFGFRFPKQRIYCSEPTRIATKGDILISVRAPVGDINMANETCCIGRGVASIRSKILNDSFLYYAMLNVQKQFDVFNTEGTVFGSINRKDLASFSILMPIDPLVKEFNNIVGTFDLKIEENLKQIQTLTELRDSLLPRLISGKIRV